MLNDNQKFEKSLRLTINYAIKYIMMAHNKFLMTKYKQLKTTDQFVF